MAGDPQAPPAPGGVERGGVMYEVRPAMTRARSGGEPVLRARPAGTALPAGTRAPVRRLASVVVPACQEEATIERCLEALLCDARPGELDVVVVCNGCSDATAALARGVGARLGHRVDVLELDAASKAAALRAGDSAAGS